MQQRRSRLRERLVALLELPGDVVLDVPRATLIGSAELVVENHRGLVEYRPDRVVVKVPDGRMAIDGDDLRIGYLSPDQVVLHGRISGLRYVPPEGGGA
ncbi:sporulation protein YqfC [Symbiobacterium terraclitae]|uniref:sporulation protein YqfC n=1 Tax=Symbiobacterium terraclitae TaxID=557451 RepID=UPI0035B53DBE